MLIKFVAFCLIVRVLRNLVLFLLFAPKLHARSISFLCPKFVFCRKFNKFSSLSPVLTVWKLCVL